MGLALETALFGDEVRTIIHPDDGVTMQWEPVLKKLVGTKLVSIPGQLIFPLELFWISQILTQAFWDNVANMDNKAALKALYLPKANYGICVEPDGERHELWGRPQALQDKADAKLAAKSAKIDIAEESEDDTTLDNPRKRKLGPKAGSKSKRCKRGKLKAAPKPAPSATTMIWETIEVYEELDQQGLAEAVSAETAKSSPAQMVGSGVDTKDADDDDHANKDDAVEGDEYMNEDEDTYKVEYTNEETDDKEWNDYGDTS